MKIVITALFCLALQIVCYSQDTLFFKSSFEKDQFAALRTDRSDIIKLLIAFDSDSSAFSLAKNKLNGFYYYIDSKRAKSKSEKTFAKELFKEVHAFFLRQYEETIPFSRIFKDGYYNCVSATALFAIILDKYGIPYYIKEVPTHVFLVAYPNTHNILFETTNPQGFYAPDTKTKESYVNQLIKAKFTTQEYVNKVGYSAAFQDFYYAKDNIDLRKIAGIQYFNEALDLSHEDQDEPAVHSIMKACELYPSKKNDFLKISLIGAYLNKSKYAKPADILYLIELGNTLRDEKVKKDVVESFRSIIHTQLYENSNDTILLQSYQLLNKRIKDSTLRRDITFQYNFGLASWYHAKGKSENAIRYARLAHRQSPNNINIQDLIWRCIVSKTSMTTGNSGDIQILNNYEAEFPFLKGNIYFRSLFALNYAFAGYRQFLADQEEEGYRLMHLLESEIKTNGKDLLLNESQVAMMYAEAGAYHFRMKNYKKAKEIILKGFEYAPQDAELKARLEIVEDEMRKK